MSDLEARIAEVVTKHRAGATNSVQTCCMCDSTWRTHADHDIHAAAPLRQMIRDAKVEALREAADEWAEGEWAAAFMAADDDASAAIAVTAWLQTRADNLDAS